MTLIAWVAKWLADKVRRRIERLRSDVVGVVLYEQLVYLESWLAAYLELRTRSSNEIYYSVLPIYAPLVPYVWFGAANLSYWSRSSREYQELAGFWQSSFTLYDLPPGIRMLVIYLDLPKSEYLRIEEDYSHQYLYTEEHAHQYLMFVLPKLLPVLLF